MFPEPSGAAVSQLRQSTRISRDRLGSNCGARPVSRAPRGAGRAAGQGTPRTKSTWRRRMHEKRKSCECRLLLEASRSHRDSVGLCPLSLLSSDSESRGHRGRLGPGHRCAQNLPQRLALSRFAWPLPPEATLRKSGCSQGGFQPQPPPHAHRLGARALTRSLCDACSLLRAVLQGSIRSVA